MKKDQEGRVKVALNTIRREFAFTALFSMAINLLMLVSPIFMLQIYDRILSSRNELTLLMIFIIAVVLLMVMGLLDIARSRLMVRTSKRIDANLSDTVFHAACEHKLLSPRDGQNGGTVRDVGTIRQFMTGAAIFSFFDTPWVPIYIAIIFMMHPYLGVTALIGGIIIFTMAYLNEILTKDLTKEAHNSANRASGFLSSSLRNVEVIKAMGMIRGIRDKWRLQQDAYLFNQAKASDRAGLVTASSKAFRLILQASILGMGAWLAIRQEISPGMMIAASIIMGRGLAPIEQAIGTWQQFQGVRVAYARLNTILAAIPPEKEGMPLPPPKGRLSVEALMAVPPGGQTIILKNVTFGLAPGEAMGVVGPSGAGKSTLARVLMGVWPARSGSARLDRADIYAWDKADLGPHVGYLPQDVELFDGTVAENIARFGEIDPDKVVQAAQRAGVHDTILHLPNGYDTAIGQDGGMLSGGQRQRIGLARAIYGEPVFVVLDEPNSNLDTAGEQALAEALTTLKARGVTLILITHRPSVLALVDTLLFLKDGMVNLLGPRDQVLQKLGQKPLAPPVQRVPKPAYVVPAHASAAATSLKAIAPAPMPRPPAKASVAVSK